MKKAVFLDRDGTINKEKNYLYKKEDFSFLPGVIEGLKILQNAGYMLVIITNQSGIGRGYYTENEFNILCEWMQSELKKEGIVISGIYYCPHLPDAPIEKYRVACSCRKPKTGMFELAAKELNIDMSASWTVGDRLRDCIVAQSLNCKGILVENSEDKKTIQDIRDKKYRAVTYAENLLEASKLIAAYDSLGKNGGKR